ncbi:unnamed protein product, partial [marine sediment metagenome]
MRTEKGAFHILSLKGRRDRNKKAEEIGFEP